MKEMILNAIKLAVFLIDKANDSNVYCVSNTVRNLLTKALIALDHEEIE